MTPETILAYLILDENYCRDVFPYLKEEYFDKNSHRKIFDSIYKYIIEYKSPPTPLALKVLIQDRTDINENDYKEIKQELLSFEYDENTNKEWLIKETEKYCQEKAFINALMKCVSLQEGGGKEKGAAPEIMSEALSVSFDTHIGHDYFEESEDRFDFYKKIEERMPFDIDILNKITKGGLPKKSLTVYLASTGAGKSLVMCHQAAFNLMQNRNVLYITLEMAEERISERIDANLLDVTLDSLNTMTKDTYLRKMHRLKNTSKGKLIVKEYPTGTASVTNFRHLLNELKLKKKFIPDIIYIDYINLCASSRVKSNTGANSYTIIKSIAEEIRGLAMECNIPIVSATQTNRSGYDNSDIELTDTSESIGLPQTVDALFALISSEQLNEMGQLMIKQLKNRWGDLSFYKRFVVGIDRSKMKLYDLEESAQNSIAKDTNYSDKNKNNNHQTAKEKFNFFDDE